MAALYDQFRPSYPKGLIEWLTPEPGGTAIDVGCGTGQVSRLLRAAGWSVVAVEVDERMAVVARRSGLDVHVSRFEDWNSPVTGVDLICSGQAWHWIDPAIGYEKAASLLRPGGHLAVFWNNYRYEPSVARAIQDVYQGHAPEVLVDCVPLGTADITLGIQFPVPDQPSHRFGPVTRRTFVHAREQTIDEWLNELLTHSIHQDVADDVTAAVLAELRAALEATTSGKLHVNYETVVASAALD
jgi:SAM-dependent methyltransferase